jgi:hypothetical protein
VGSYEHGDESSGSGAMELVFCLLRKNVKSKIYKTVIYLCDLSH